MRISVPGNLLLLGEYGVLEEGGLGVALAVERRVRIEVKPAPKLEVTGSWGGERRAQPSPLASAVVESCRRRLAGRGRDLPSAHVAVDSSAFYSAGGRKTGFGSSSAVAVGLAWALLAEGGTAPDAREVLDAALEAHRQVQGGLGSGYDACASLYGGIGLFTGGSSPLWQPLALAWLEPLYLFQGVSSVSTPASIDRYREWKSRHPRRARRFLAGSNRNVNGFALAATRGEAASWFARGRELGIRLGDRIGVEARITAPLPVRECKALGAGNELGAWFPPAAPPFAPQGASALAMSREGVRWEP